MNTRIPAQVQRRIQRYVAILLAVTVPVLAVVEWVGTTTPNSPLRWIGYAVLGGWAVYVARDDRATAVPLVLAIMGYVCSMIIVETLLGVEVTAFDFTSTFGLMIVLSVLAGALVAGNRLVWAAGLGSSVAIWVTAIGVLQSHDPGILGVRVVVAVTGVVFTTALVSGLFEQLAEAIESHDRAARLQDAIASCSEALLVHSDAFAVYEATRVLQEAIGAEYAYVDQTIEIEGEPGWEIIADAGSGLTRSGGRWRKGKYSSIPSTYRALSTGRAIAVRTDQLSGPEQEPYIDDGIVSEVSVPIFVGTTMRGSVGFIQYKEDRDWTDVEIQTLWRAAHMIGAYWRRQDDAEELRASNESKDRLLASVSHEIRTPLTAIVGLSEELVSSRTSLGDEELDELNGIIAIQSRELAELVEDLLVASRADFGNLSIKAEEIDLLDQARRVVEGVRESHPTHKQVSLDGVPTPAWADPLRVRQVIRNLLTNAVKYGGDRIVVRVVSDETSATVIVADDGGGVPEAETSLIFERYYRSAQSPTMPGSVGIGLPLARQLSEMMGGTLEYVRGDSHPRFEFTLPAPVSDDDLASDDLVGVVGS